MGLGELLKGQLKLGKLEISGGKAKISAIYDSNGLDVELSVSLEANMVLDEISKLIPGGVDDFLIKLIEAQLSK